MLHIVLFQPEIPENTGNIARTCVAFNAKLHLIRPYGFFLDSANLKRSAVNYWDKLNYQEYDTYEDFIEMNHLKSDSSVCYITRYGKHPSNKIDFEQKDLYLIFGKESTGIDKPILKAHYEHTYRIPTSINVRALNLSNCVAMLSYEYVKAHQFENLSLVEPFKKTW